MTLPLLKPMFVILTSLSIIWDFRVFTQIWIMLNGQPSRLLPDGHLPYARRSDISDYGLGSAIALVMMLIMLVRQLRLHPRRWCGSGRCD